MVLLSLKRALTTPRGCGMNHLCGVGGLMYVAATIGFGRLHTTGCSSYS